ncbi:MAG: histidine kinase [Bacteroidota bacterium]
MNVRLVLFLGLLTVGADCAAQTVKPTEGRFRAGDDLRWAAPDWDDRDWERRGLLDTPDTTAVLWGRFRLQLDGSTEAPGLLVAGAAAREVYWDGVLLGRTGQVGTDRESEVAGPLDAVFALPDSLATPGDHVIAIRFSTFRRPPRASGLLLNIQVLDLKAAATTLPWTFLAPLVFLGGFLLIALYYGVLYASDRTRTPYLLTSLLCLVVAGLLVAESWRSVVGYPYDLHGVRLALINGLTWAVGVLMAATFAVQFAVPRGRWIVAGLGLVAAIVLLATSDHETGTFAVFALALAVALGLTGRAVMRRQPGAALALGGVLICALSLLAAGRDFMEGAFFPAFGALLAGLLTSLGLQTRDQWRRHEAALAAAARLEAELLKKHLQPHFLMNSLASVIEWVERDPSQGVQALEALADELRALGEVSGETTIPMRRELALCRSHLRVMSFRHDVQLELDAEGVDPSRPIPPAVIHTLIENAVTHNAYASGSVTLTLHEEVQEGRRRLTLRTPLASSTATVGPEGGGLRYVRARLEEAMPGQWALASSVEDDAWVTRIDLPA